MDAEVVFWTKMDAFESILEPLTSLAVATQVMMSPGRHLDQQRGELPVPTMLPALDHV